jgi:hypothetical protein
LDGNIKYDPKPIPIIITYLKREGTTQTADIWKLLRES